MKTVEERLTQVEHKVAENARGIEGLREAVVEGFKAIDRRFEALDRQFETLDRRFESMEQRFDQRFQSMEQRLDRRFEVVDQKMARQFLWVVGIQITTMLAVVAAMGGIAAVALGR